MKKNKILTCAAFTALMIISLTAHYASAATTSTFTLSSSGIRLPIMLPDGTMFNGSISTTGTVRVWVSDPNGSQIANLGLIDSATTFGFVAEQTGNYTMNFENDLPASIQVTFSYVTDPEISSGNSTGTPISYLLISVVIAVAGSFLIIFFMRRKRKNQAHAG